MRFVPPFVRVRGLLLLVVVAALALVAARMTGRTTSPAIADRTMDHGAMSDPMMLQMVKQFYATHPQHPVAGDRLNQVAFVPVDSFTAVNFRFEEDGNAATQIDTAKIQVGQAIHFKWGTGFHTVTSGTGSTDPNVGHFFDHSMAAVTDSFTFKFDTVATIPFFCRIHETFNMRGVIKVSGTTGVPFDPPRTGRLGFVSALAPNPSSSGIAFRFALAAAGRAQVDVFDAQGRRVAAPIDGSFSAGEHAGAWDGRDTRGGRVSPGVYSVRLRVPGSTQVREVTLVH